MKTSVELREKRAAIVSQARELIERAKGENRDMSAEEEGSYDTHMVEVDRLKGQIDRMEKLEAAERDLDEPGERRGAPLDGETRERQGETRGNATRTVNAAYREWLRTGTIRPEIRSDQSRLAEYRDTIIGTDAKGGYLITPTKISEDIVKLIDDEVFVRQLCAASGSITRVTDAKSLGIRKMTTRMADADWTTEVAAVTEDTTMAFGRRDLTPSMVTKLAKISIRTLLLSTDAEREVNNELAYKFGITEEKAYLTGDGSAKPLGIFTASANGISTSRDVTAASATVVAGDDLINVKYSIKQGYLKGPSVGWVLSREFVKRVRKLKVATTTGGNDLEYLWQPGLTGGAPDRILDLPIYMSEYAPTTFTTGLYVAVLGNFKYYRIAEVVDMVIQRLVERYADTNEVGFIGRRWVDGSVVQEEAFGRLKLA